MPGDEHQGLVVRGVLDPAQAHATILAPQLLEGVRLLRRRDLLQGASETLVFLLQQHNAREENVLYPIAEQLLDPQQLQLQQTHTGRR